MQNNKGLFVAILCGILAVVFVKSYIGKREKEILQLGLSVKVVTAARDIPEGSRLDDTVLEVTEVPKTGLLVPSVLL